MVDKELNLKLNSIKLLITTARPVEYSIILEYVDTVLLNIIADNPDYTVTELIELLYNSI